MPPRVMSMQPVPWPDPDPVVAAAIGAMYGSRKSEPPLAVTVRDRLGEWLRDEELAGAFGVRGRPGWPPSRLALVTVLQRAENLSYRMAAEAVRTRLDWKYLLGLSLEDPGSGHSVLPEFRARVANAELEQVPLDALLERLSADGLVKAGGKQRTDSTHVVAAVAELNQLDLAGEGVRVAVEALAAAHPGWVASGRGSTAPQSPAGISPPRRRSRTRSPLLTRRTGTHCCGPSTTGVAGLAGGASRGRGAPENPGPELHPGHPRERAGGDRAAGEETA